MKKSGYMTRALKSRDPRFAQVLGKLGYERRDMVADAVPARAAATPDDIPALREEYERVVGKRPFMGWDADTLRAKIAAAN